LKHYTRKKNVSPLQTAKKEPPSDTKNFPKIGPFAPEYQPELVPVINDKGVVIHYKSSTTTEGVYSSAAGFRYPFIKTVLLPARNEKVPVRTGSRVDQVPVRVYRDGNGEFVRAEFARKGDYAWEELPEYSEALYEMHGESLKRMPPHQQRLSLPKIIEILDHHVPLAEARQWAITAVQIDSGAGIPPDRQYFSNYVYVAHVYGVVTAGGLIPDEERFKKARYVLDLDGGMIQWDNRL
jgi:hypothetical protein